jgi:hypothetical protein
MMNELAFRRTVCGINDEMTIRSYFSLITSGRYFVYVTARKENPISHKYVVTKGGKKTYRFV